MQEDKTICPYCGKKMNKMKVPDLSTWDAEFFYVCFNDECSYYVKGWKHIEQTMKTAASYRHRYDPVSGAYGPLPVWSPDACKSEIIDD